MIVHPKNRRDPIELDDSLWVSLGNSCPGKHYLLHNPHTFTGRIAVFSEQQNQVFNISKSEIVEYSSEAANWLKGYLAGCEPDAPLSETGDYLEDDHPRMIEWRTAIQEFPQTGFWYFGARQCDSCGNSLLPSTIGTFCHDCRPGSQEATGNRGI
jgi:hypothetical protein